MHTRSFFHKPHTSKRYREFWAQNLEFPDLIGFQVATKNNDTCMNCEKEWHIDYVVKEEWMGCECDKWVCCNEKCMELLRLHMKSCPLAKIKMFNVQ